MATKDEVSQFLKELKSVSAAGEIFFIDRQVNTQTLAELEIKALERKAYIEKLVLEDYSEGPLDNDQYGIEPMWVFGKKVKEKEVYIKITITALNVICILSIPHSIL
ncbi:hypothetical protein SAMN05660493_03074 [Epilithonimonas bovis DSM 19482]|uniref:Uncharacterized protein n=1 Tax=Epilithonimonas bovis DSM 19482 TaxID=1121284 RepID=A0A1U7Q1A1_9FLAO|nr:hypothetical protein [Epilithonimonas bovis]SIT98331.1 hypothetical protein SAMN05660493_03074 [Epilithonimonas bovis DSM 19482]